MKYKLFKKKAKTSFFSLKIINTRNYNVSYYKGWHDLLVLRINLLNSTITQNFFNLFETKKNEKLEKVIMVSKGKLSIGKKIPKKIK